MREKLWGDHYFDTFARMWKKNPKAENGTILKRVFVQFLMDPIIRLTGAIMNGNDEAIDKILNTIGI